jgi:hypothetical protein
MYKKLLAASIAALLSTGAMAQNYGFEDGTLSGWTVGGDTGATPTTGTVQGFTGTVNNITWQGLGVKLLNGPIAFQAGSHPAVGTPGTDYYQPAVTPKTWVFSPYGNYMVGLQPNQGQSATAFTELGLTSTSVAAINQTILTQKNAAGYGMTGITTAAWIYRDVAMTPGTTMKFGWNYVGTDYVPFNDGSIATLVNTSDNTVLGKVNNYTAQYALLGFTNPKTGDYSAGTFGSTGWQLATFDVTTAGTYKLGFASFNLGDTALSPLLLVDEWQGTTNTCVSGTCTVFGVVAPNNSTAPTVADAGGSGSGGSTPTPPTPPTPPAPTLVNNITGAVTTATLDTAPKFNGGTLTVADGDVINKNFTVATAGGTITTPTGAVSEISGVISNDGTDTTGPVTVTGNGTLKLSATNTYTGPTAINNGATVVVLNSNALAGSSSVTNNGGLNITGAGTTGINVNGYTQGTDGGLIAKLWANGDATKITSTGPVNLAGTYSLYGDGTGTYAVGKYPLLTGSSVTGQFGTFASNLSNYTDLGYYLKYTPTGVQLWMTPNPLATQASIDNVANNVSGNNSLQAGVLNGSLGNDSNVYGDTGGSITVNYGNTKVGSGELNTAGITASKKVNDNWRVGVFADQPLNNPTVGGVTQSNNPGFGGFVAWNQNTDQTGLGIQVSGVQNSGDATIKRTGPETGIGKAKTDGKAYQVKATYTKAIDDKTSVTPYVGVRHTEVNTGGYTEQGAQFPLTVNSNTHSTTDVLAGVGVSHKLTDKLTATGAVGVTQNVSSNTGSFSGTSDIAGKGTFNNALPNNGKTSVGVGAGLSYAVTKNSKVGVNVGFQDKTPSGNNVGYVGVSYTIGF